MGRSSGGSGSHSSGGFGGSHSSGGFSGGGRTSNGGFSGPSRNTGYHNRPPRPHPEPIFREPHYHRPVPGYSYRNSSSNIWATVIVFIIILIFIMMPNIQNMTFNSTKLPKNTTQRVALNGVVSKTDWYEDNIGWITSKNTLITGLEEFYKKTGIQPYVLLIPYSTEYWNGNDINATKADEYLENVYAEKFKDEAHFIFAYFQCKNDSKTEMDGEFRYLSRHSADTIMDNEAISILWGYFEKNYYNTSLSIEKMISNTFSETAKSIMSKPTNIWDFVIILVVAIAIIVIIVFTYKIIKSKHQREKEKEEFTEKILEKPLETFETDTSELEKKYEKNK